MQTLVGFIQRQSWIGISKLPAVVQDTFEVRDILLRLGHGRGIPVLFKLVSNETGHQDGEWTGCVGIRLVLVENIA
jgi:hypothetical protein